MLCGSLDERGVWGRMDTCMCVAESLHCSHETITILLVSYPPIENRKFQVKKKKKKKLHVDSYGSFIHNNILPVPLRS